MSLSLGIFACENTEPYLDITPPTLLISTKEPLEVNTTGKVIFTFSEEVLNFTSDQVNFVDNTTVVKGKFTTNSLDKYFLEITPKSSESITVKIFAYAVQDNDNNFNPSIFMTNFLVSQDTTPPTLTISTSSSLEENFPVDIFFIFNEDVTNFTLDDIETSDFKVDKGKFTTNNSKEYKWNTTPRASGNLKITIPTGGLQDLTGNSTTTTLVFDILISPSGTSTYTISFIPNGAVFSNPKVTTLKVVKGSRISKDQLNKILSYHPTGPQPNMLKITRKIFEWRINSSKYDLNIPPINNMTLEAVWSNSCGKVETFHPKNKNELKKHIISVVNSNPNADLNYIDTSAIIKMNSLFYLKNFNGNIACWNLAKVEDMSGLFFGANKFDQDISKWNVANVTDMSSMFENASKFNQDIGSWNVAKVQNMNSMFHDAFLFNQNISNWNVVNVTDMSSMFHDASSFNQNIGSWNVAKVTDMSSMFENASTFNQNIGSWNLANVTDMSLMFHDAYSFNQNIGSWNVAKVTDMSSMFQEATTFNQDIGSWNVAKVTNMSSMFQQASKFNKDIGSWNVAKVTDMSSMFEHASKFNKDIGSWNVAKVTDMSSMFEHASKFNKDIGSWNVDKVTDMSSMFEHASRFNQNINSWNVDKVTDMSSMFEHASRFNQNINSWNVAKVTDMSSMFQEASLFNQNIGNWNVANVWNMNSMFQQASKFNQNLNNWSVKKIATWNNIFGQSAMVKKNKPQRFR